MLKKITLLRERVRRLERLSLLRCHHRCPSEIDILIRASSSSPAKTAPENPLLLEAIAAHYGFGPEGGNRNIHHDTTKHNHSTDALVRALRLSFDRRTGLGFFFRAESFFNTASNLDKLDDPLENDGIGPSPFFPAMAAKAFTPAPTGKPSSPSSNASSPQRFIPAR